MQCLSVKHGYKFLFGKVNVILGANGAGKSNLLREFLASKLTDSDYKSVYIEGGRTIEIKDVLKFEVGNFRQYEAIDIVLSNYDKKRSKSLADRLFDALILLDNLDAKIKSQHSDAVSHWHASGQQGSCPVRSKPPLERFFEMFNEIFPRINLKYYSDKKRIEATKDDNVYGPSGLSDGEKQVFSILADLLELDDIYKVVIVDEPELNLHPELAERVWTIIEDEFPDKVFIYATHSIGFALRENVSKVWVLSTESANIAEFSNLADLQRTESLAFLGSLPGILSANQVLVTEGYDKSFDALFYPWIIDDPKVEIFPAGACTEVVSVVNKSGVWEKITSKVKLIGIIDSDFRAEGYTANLAEKGVHAIPFHEAEAYVCLPDVVVAVANRIGAVEFPPTKSEIENLIIANLQAEKLSIAAQRVFCSSDIRLGMSLKKKDIKSACNREELLQKMKEAAADEVGKAESHLSSEVVESRLDIELIHIESVIDRRNIGEALRLLPSKELANTLAGKAGCRNAAALMRSLRTNFKPADFEHTKWLSENIQRSLSY